MNIKKNLINVGLIGAGQWGVNYIKTINSISGVNLKLIYTSNKEIKNIIKSNCKITTDINLFFNKNEFDGIIISTPPKVQFDLTMKFIQTGIPLLLEKPLCTSFREANIILRACQKFKSSILVDNIFLHSEPYKIFKKILNNEKDFLSFNAIHGNIGPFRKYMNSYWDWGPHCLSLCLDLMGKPLSGSLQTSLNHYKNGENYTIKLKFENGKKANLTFGNSMKEKIRFFQVKLANNKGKLTFNDLANKKVYRSLDLNNKYFKYNDKEPLVSVVEEFIQNIISGNSNTKSLKLNYEMVYILETLFLNKSAKFI